MAVLAKASVSKISWGVTVCYGLLQTIPEVKSCWWNPNSLVALFCCYLWRWLEAVVSCSFKGLRSHWFHSAMLWGLNQCCDGDTAEWTPVIRNVTAQPGNCSSWNTEAMESKEPQGMRVCQDFLTLEHLLRCSTVFPTQPSFKYISIQGNV